MDTAGSSDVVAAVLPPLKWRIVSWFAPWALPSEYLSWVRQRIQSPRWVYRQAVEDAAWISVFVVLMGSFSLLASVVFGTEPRSKNLLIGAAPITLLGFLLVAWTRDKDLHEPGDFALLVSAEGAHKARVRARKRARWHLPLAAVVGTLIPAIEWIVIHFP